MIGWLGLLEQCNLVLWVIICSGESRWYSGNGQCITRNVRCHKLTNWSFIIIIIINPPVSSFLVKLAKIGQKNLIQRWMLVTQIQTNEYELNKYEWLRQEILDLLILTLDYGISRKKMVLPQFSPLQVLIYIVHRITGVI